MFNGFGTEWASFGERSAERAAEERADGRKLARQGPAFHAVVPAPGHEAAEIGNREAGKVRYPCRLAQMVLEEPAELREVAGIGLQRLCRHAALGFQRLQPGHGSFRRVTCKSELKTITHAQD
jgi:hypothetical protein